MFMAIKVKEIKDGAVVSIKVNKSFYMMTKALSFYLYQNIGKENKNDEYIKDIMTKSYADMDDLQKSFYTVTLLLAEMESQFKTDNMYVEKDILQPGDEGYIEPTEG
jgi:hypothetical protein